MLKTIEIPVSDELATIYEHASENDKAQLHSLIKETIVRMKQSTEHPLLQWADAVSAEAQSKGLTPKLLDELLADE
jgi:hypothetical protein